jgi:hypothetical protein
MPQLTMKSILHLVFIYFSNLVTKWVVPNSHPKISSLKGEQDGGLAHNHMIQVMLTHNLGWHTTPLKLGRQTTKTQPQP